MITISLNSPVPLHDQLVQEIRRLLADGTLQVGDELPPVRQLANDLGINLNTVARAYRELTEHGLLATSRGRGTVVLSTTERRSSKSSEERKKVEITLGAALADAKIAGLSRHDIEQLVQKQLQRLWAET
jgi:GntR family transcriptional regulator